MKKKLEKKSLLSFSVFVSVQHSLLLAAKWPARSFFYCFAQQMQKKRTTNAQQKSAPFWCQIATGKRSKFAFICVHFPPLLVIYLPLSTFTIHSSPLALTLNWQSTVIHKHASCKWATKRDKLHDASGENHLGAQAAPF